MATVETKNRATSSEESRKDVLKRVDKEKVEFVLLWFTGPRGAPQELCDHARRARRRSRRHGLRRLVDHWFNAIEESDMVAIPDPETFQLMPWKEGAEGGAA